MSSGAKTSFCSETKEELLGLKIKNRCCSVTFHSLTENGKDDADIRGVYEKIRCDECRRELIKGVFILFGNVTDPNKEYHLDFTFRNSDDKEIIGNILSGYGFDFKESRRKNLFVLYLKDGDGIADFLASIGANNASFEVINSKMMREFRNNINREVNCEAANIKKKVNASVKYVKAIEYLKKSGHFESLDDELKEVSEIRLENPEDSLGEIAIKCSSAVSKSGVRHRLEKVYGIYNSLINR